MAVELGSLTLEKLTHVGVRERARVAYHAVPGLAGDLTQTLGRSSVEAELCGICYGPTGAADLAALRQVYLEQRPVDFFADAVGAGYFSQVLISRLDVRQRAGALDEFEFSCAVIEYVEPPEPIAPDPFGALDAGILEEAGAFIDDVQNAIEGVADLVNTLANLPSFGDPTSRLRDLPSGYQSLVTGTGVSTLTEIRNLF